MNTEPPNSPSQSHLGTDLLPPGQKRLEFAALLGQSLLTKEVQGFTTLPAQPLAQANDPRGPLLLPLAISG